MQTPVYEVLARMRGATLQLAVVMEDGKVQGIVTLADIVKRVLPEGGAAQRATVSTEPA